MSTTGFPTPPAPARFLSTAASLGMKPVGPEWRYQVTLMSKGLLNWICDETARLLAQAIEMMKFAFTQKDETVGA